MDGELEARKAELARELEQARTELLEVAQGLSAEDWRRPTDNPGWTARDVLAHLAAGETTVQPLLRRLAAGEGGVPDDFDLARYNAGQLRRRAERTIAELLEELAEARAQTLEALRQATPESLARRGRHPRGFEATLEQTFRLIALHDREHAEDIRRATSRAVRPAASPRAPGTAAT